MTKSSKPPANRRYSITSLLIVSALLAAFISPPPSYAGTKRVKEITAEPPEKQLTKQETQELVEQFCNPEFKNSTNMVDVVNQKPEICDGSAERQLKRWGVLSRVGLEGRNKQGNSLLIEAVRAGNVNLVKALIAKKVDLESKDKQGRTALQIAFQMSEGKPEQIGKFDEIAAAIIQAGGKFNLKIPTQEKGKKQIALWFFATENQYPLALTAMIAQGANLEQKDPLGRTALFISIDKHRFGIGHLLLKSGASLYKQNKIVTKQVFSEGLLSSIVTSLEDKKNPLTEVNRQGAVEFLKDLLSTQTIDSDSTVAKAKRLILLESVQEGHVNTVRDDAATPSFKVIEEMKAALVSGLKKNPKAASAYTDLFALILDKEKKARLARTEEIQKKAERYFGLDRQGHLSLDGQWYVKKQKFLTQEEDSQANIDSAFIRDKFLNLAVEKDDVKLLSSFLGEGAIFQSHLPHGLFGHDETNEHSLIEFTEKKAPHLLGDALAISTHDPQYDKDGNTLLHRLIKRAEQHGMSTAEQEEAFKVLEQAFTHALPAYLKGDHFEKGHLLDILFTKSQKDPNFKKIRDKLYTEAFDFSQCKQTDYPECYYSSPARQHEILSYIVQTSDKKEKTALVLDGLPSVHSSSSSISAYLAKLHTLLDNGVNINLNLPVENGVPSMTQTLFARLKNIFMSDQHAQNQLKRLMTYYDVNSPYGETYKRQMEENNPESDYLNYY